jgi:hypothetical protein
MPGYLGSAQISMGEYLYDVSIDANRPPMGSLKMIYSQKSRLLTKNALAFADSQWVTFHLGE